MNFKEFITTDRENRNNEKFEGTFLDYLETKSRCSKTFT